MDEVRTINNKIEALQKKRDELELEILSLVIMRGFILKIW